MRNQVLQSLSLVFVVLQFARCVDLHNKNIVYNGTDSVNNVTAVNGTARNSRQLFSLVKNVLKAGLEQGVNNGGIGGGGLGGSGGLGTLASLFGSALANGVNSNAGQLYQQQNYLQPRPTLGPEHFSSPNDYMHYLLANSQNNQHVALPHYLQMQQKEQESTADLIEKYQEQMASGSDNLETAANTGSQLLNKLAMGTLFDDIDKVSNLLSFRTVENMIGKVNRFDKLKCIPRLMCQMVAKRAEDARQEEEKKKAKARDDSETTTRRPTQRKVDEEEDGEDEGKLEKKENVDEPEAKERNEDEEDDEEEEDDSNGEDDDDSGEEKEYVVIKKGADDSSSDGKQAENKTKGRREGRFLNFNGLNGGDAALEQFVRFLDVMQLKDWSLYPYLHGAYQGHQVTRSSDCATKFHSCPFTDDQLVYYFNNYNGGFFQSI